MNFDYELEIITPVTSGALTINGLLEESITASVAAAGTNQGSATVLTTNANVITSGTGGVQLPVPSPGGLGPGLTAVIINRSGVTITIYPSSGVAIDGLSANTGFSLPNLASVALQTTSSTQWYTTQPIGSVAGTANGGPGTITFVSSNPAAGNLDNIYVNTSTNLIYYDNGTSLVQLAVGSGGGATISNITTNSTYYPLFTSSTSGTLSTVDVSSSTLSFNPNTAILTVGSTSPLTINGTSATITATTTNASITLSPNGSGSVIVGPTSSGTISSNSGQSLTITGATSLTLAGTTSGVVVSTPLITTANAAVSAAGTAQGTATSITSDNNDVTTVGAGSGVVLPTAVLGRIIRVMNDGANPLLIYPASGALIDSLAANIPVILYQNQTWVGIGLSATAWGTVSVSWSTATTTGLLQIMSLGLAQALHINMCMP